MGWEDIRMYCLYPWFGSMMVNQTEDFFFFFLIVTFHEASTHCANEKFHITQTIFQKKTVILIP